jgi:transposase-like protein
MERSKLSREFKLEVIKLVGAWGVAVAQAVRDINWM